MSSSTESTGAALVVQLTDSHLFGCSDARLWGVDTEDSLRAVVALVAQEWPEVDLLLASGDLAQDGSPGAYRKFCQATESLAQQALWTPGNHDDAAEMQAVAGERLLSVLDCGAWRVLVLNSQVPGEVAGGLAAATLDALRGQLEQAADRYLLLVLHHPPFPVGSPAMDAIGLRDPQPFWDLLADFPGVRAVLCGHVHQAYEGRRGHLRLLTSPSTCVQFAPGAEVFTVSAEAPGYRWLRLNSDGSLDTGVSRVAGRSGSEA